MSGAEVGLVLGIISSAIAIWEACDAIWDAAHDTQGLPAKIRACAEQVPLVIHILNLAGQRIESKQVDEEGRKSAVPILERCRDNAGGIRDLFDKCIPPKDASKAERLKKAVGIKSRSSSVKEKMDAVLADLGLLAQQTLLEDHDAISDIKEAVEQLARVEDDNDRSHFAHYGSGDQFGNSGSGTQKNYINKGKDAEMNNADTINIQKGDSKQASLQLYEILVGRTTPLDDKSRILDQRGDRAAGTCQWILEDVAYKSWWNSHKNGLGILAITGNAGSGKTMMSTYLAEKIEAENTNTETDGVYFAFFFCTARDRHRSTALSILQGWLHHLARSERYLQDLRSAFAARREAHAEILSDFQSLWQAFVETLNVSSATRFVLLVDALDECPEKQRKILLKHFLRLEHGVFQGRVRLILTCRSDHHFSPAQLSDKQKICMQGDRLKGDLERVIDERVDCLAQDKSYDPELKLDIKTELLKRSSGSHLWISLAIRELGLITNNLQSLPRLRAIPKDLFAFYDEILCRVEASNASEVRFLLHIRLAALADLTIMDIAVARSLLPGNPLCVLPDLQYLANDVTQPSATEVWELKGRLEKCTDLVSVDSQGVVDFIHPTVAEYLLQTTSLRSNDVCHSVFLGLVVASLAFILNKFLSKIQLSLALLSLAALTRSWITPSRRKRIASPSVLCLRLYRYARVLPRTATLWLVRQIYCTDIEQANLCAFQVAFQSISKSTSGIEERYGPGILKIRTYATKSLQTHASKCRDSLDQHFPWQATFDQDKLESLECWMKQEAFLDGRLLCKIVKTGANINTCIQVLEEDVHDKARTPLIVAAMNGNVAATSVLVDAGASVDSQDEAELTALHHAVLENHTAVVAKLLEAGANVNIADVNGDPPSISALKQQTGVHDTLYENFTVMGDSLTFVGDIDIVNQTAMGKSIWLDSALRFPRPEREALISTLIEHDADINARDRKGQTLLSTAAMNHRWKMVDDLLDRGADPDITDSEGMNALLRALWSPRTVQSIRQCVIKGTSKVWLGSAIVFDHPISKTAHDPAESSYSQEYVTSVISKLITKTSNLEVRGPAGRTALSIAAENGHIATVERLLNRNADANTLDNQKMNPLMWSCRQPRFRRLIIDHVLAEGNSRVCVGTLLMRVERKSHSTQHKNYDNDSKSSLAHIDATTTAVRKERRDIITMLALKTFDVNSWDQSGICALHHARDQDLQELTENDLAAYDLGRPIAATQSSIADILKAQGATLHTKPGTELTEDYHPADDSIIVPFAESVRCMSNFVVDSARAVVSMSGGSDSRQDLSLRGGMVVKGLAVGVPSLESPGVMQRKNGRLAIDWAPPKEISHSLNLRNCLEMPWTILKNIVIRGHCRFVDNVIIVSLESPTIKVLSGGAAQRRPMRFQSIHAMDNSIWWSALVEIHRFSPGYRRDYLWKGGETPLHVLIESLFRTVGPDQV